MSLKEEVSRALAAAVENGYEAEMRAMSPEGLAMDLFDQDADVAASALKEGDDDQDKALVLIEPYVKEWMGMKA